MELSKKQNFQIQKQEIKKMTIFEFALNKLKPNQIGRLENIL